MVHFFNNLNYRDSKHSKPQNLVQNKKKQDRHPERRKHTKDPLWLSWCFSLRFFWHYETFSKIFGLHHFNVSIICNKMDVKKSQRVPPFIFFGNVTLFKNLNFDFFGKFFKVSLFNIFHILQQTGVSKSPKGPPSTILKTLRFLSCKYEERLV